VDCNSPVKDRDTLIEQLVTQINERAHRIVKQVVYNKFYEANKDRET